MVTETLPANIQEVLSIISNELDMDNYTTEDEEGNSIPWATTQVLYCKLTELLALDWQSITPHEEVEYRNVLEQLTVLLSEMQLNEEAE
jgi:hypothetical protein